METEQDLIEFAIWLRQEITDALDTSPVARLSLHIFTDYIIEMLADAGEFDGGTESYYKSRGIEVSGYNLDREGTLSLFIAHYTNSVPPESLGKNTVEKIFSRLYNFLQKAIKAPYYTALEDSSKAFDMAQHIYENREEIVRVQLYLFTDALLTNVDYIPNKTFNNMPVSHHIWDIRRLYRYTTSGQHKEPIHIDFVEQFQQSIPCLEWVDSKADYSAYLTIIPGNILKSIYELYGARLLELNVRSFLQAKGKINQGIRSTILKEPRRFLAYNNGISATASNIEVIQLPGGGLGIKSLDDLQIVNGGQTTASIFHTARKDKASVADLRIQAKISVVPSEKLGELVPLISRFANSQNKVAEADFSANDAFHVEVEKQSRLVWAPVANGTQRQTHWFYERARGQFQDELTRAGTPAQQRKFKEEHPVNQKFSKTDLAKFEMTWDQYPHIVSLGAQKCFVQFMSQVHKREPIGINQAYFQRLVAKVILFRRAEKLVSEQAFGGYRANIVTYTLAYISHYTTGRVNLKRVWQHQSIGKNLEKAIIRVSHEVHSVITNPSGGKNITEWCKRQECWTHVKNLKIDLHDLLQTELLPEGTTEEDSTEALTDEETYAIALVAAVPSMVWFQLADWAKELSGLQAGERNLCISLGERKRREKLPTKKQAIRGALILQEAKRRGFKLEMIVNG